MGKTNISHSHTIGGLKNKKSRNVMKTRFSMDNYYILKIAKSKYLIIMNLYITVMHINHNTDNMSQDTSDDKASVNA